MIRLFRPQIVALVHERDVVVARWQEHNSEADVFEDRRLDIPSQVEISVDEQIRAIDAAMDGR